VVIILSSYAGWGLYLMERQPAKNVYIKMTVSVCSVFALVKQNYLKNGKTSGDPKKEFLRQWGHNDFMSNLRFDWLCALISIQTAGRCRVTGIPSATPKEALDHLSPYGYTPMHASVARKHLSPTSKGDGRNENHRLERKPQG
jgi:hypothetical protein